MPSYSFQHWYRGVYAGIAATSPTSLSHGYRGDYRTPLVRVASMVAAEGTGGLSTGGATTTGLGSTLHAGGGLNAAGSRTGTTAFVAHIAGGLRAAGLSIESSASSTDGAGGWTPGGTSSPLDPVVATDSFSRWYRGQSISSSLTAGSGGFAHGYRGWYGLPSATRSANSSVNVRGEGGVGLGGGSTATTRLEAVLLGGLVPGGAFSLSTAHVVSTTSAGLSLGGGASSSSILSTEIGGGGLRLGSSAAVGVTPKSVSGAGLSVGGLGGASLAAGERIVGGLRFGGRFRLPRIRYRIFRNDGLGGPIDYSAHVAETHSTTWTSEPLAPGSSLRFGVRAFDAETQLLEENLDASVQLILDGEGRDVTDVPLPPVGLRAIPLAGGRARIEWTTTASTSKQRATHFHIYLLTDPQSQFRSPTAVLDALSSRGDQYAVEIDGLVDGLTYFAAVRAASVAGEEANTRLVRILADSTPPSMVDALAASPSATAS